MRNSAVDEAARALRTYALSHRDGDFIGSEEEMIERFRVSRPTLRQASARVVQENLIQIRRGVGGGYFARRPDSISVSRMAALYLMSRRSGLSETLPALRAVRAELAMRAARNKEARLRKRLLPFAQLPEVSDAVDGEHGYRAFLEVEREFGRLLGEMSKNDVLTLLLEILYDFTAHLRSDEAALTVRAEGIRRYRELRCALARAILDNDVAVAELASHRCSALVEEWMSKGLKNVSFDDAVMIG